MTEVKQRRKIGTAFAKNVDKNNVESKLLK